MNILGIGTDIVSMARIQSIWARFGYAFARKILTSIELEDLPNSQNMVGFLAKRYAAKEAVSKALGTGFRAGILLTEIGITKDALGRPHLHFTGGAAGEIKRLKVVDTHVSLSDEREFAVAFVILLK